MTRETRGVGECGWGTDSGVVSQWREKGLGCLTTQGCPESDAVTACLCVRQAETERDTEREREKDPEWSVRETERASRRGSFVSLCAWTDVI